MGLDSLVNKEEEKQKEEKTESMAEEIGVEDKEDIQELNDRLDNTYEIVANLQDKMEIYEEENKVLRAALAKVIDELEEVIDKEESPFNLSEIRWGESDK